MKTVNPWTMFKSNGKRMRTIKFYTLGCKVNQYDTQSIRERFLKHGFKEIYDGRKADVCVINTCTVTSGADQKSRAAIRKSIKSYPQARIIVTGCLIEKDSRNLKDIKGVDVIISKRFFPEEGISKFSGHTRAFLKIQDGCNNFCSYCKVPFVRGSSRSRPLEQIVCEARNLVRNGFKEIVLSGICLGAYGKDLFPRGDLIEVIEEIEKIDGLLRIRLSSIEVGDVSDKLIDKMARSNKLCKHLHIPLQSGDNRILKMMNRKYTREAYLGLIRKIKRKIPGVSITTDCLVGFPGETENHFQDTVELIMKIIPLKVHIFPYSQREGTFAVRIKKDTLAPSVMKARLFRLKEVAQQCAGEYKSGFLGKTLQVLLEESARGNLWRGYAENYISVWFKSKKNLKNQVLAIRLRRIIRDSILGVRP